MPILTYKTDSGGSSLSRDPSLSHSVLGLTYTHGWQGPIPVEGDFSDPSTHTLKSVTGGSKEKGRKETVFI